MTLRTAGLIAGVLGVILLAVGLIANWVKPAAEATPSATFETAVVVVPPAVLALSPDAVLTVETDGTSFAHTARVQDVDAWVGPRDAVTVTGIADWEELTVEVLEPVVAPSPSASPSASPSGSVSPAASPSSSPSPSVSPSPSGSASPNPSASPTPSPSVAVPEGSQDVWRDTAQNSTTYTVATADLPPGLALVIEAETGSTLSGASLTMPRTIDDVWITQVTWWGAALTIVGLIALIALFVDVRPAQTKGEEWLAQRSAIGTGKDNPKPGSRRARRAVGAQIPVATIPAEPTPTGSVPMVIIEPTTNTGPVPMIALSGPAQSAPATGEQPVPPASAFEPPVNEPPVTDNQEDRS